MVVGEPYRVRLRVRTEGKEEKKLRIPGEEQKKGAFFIIITKTKTGVCARVCVCLCL